MNECFSSMIVAADLIAPFKGWTEPERGRFRQFLREIILPLNTMYPKQNNHANWGTLLVLAVSAYLDDFDLFQSAMTRFKNLIDIQIDSDGTMPVEIARSDTKNWRGGPTKGIRGISYTHHGLMPTTISAEIMRLNGYDLFDYHSPAGGSLRAAYEKVASWCLHPETFPYFKSNHGHLKGVQRFSYFEILNHRWPYKPVEVLLNKHRPLTSDGGIPDLTLTHGEF